MTLGSNGLFLRSQDAKAQYENSTANEIEQMNDVTTILEELAKQNGGEVTPSGGETPTTNPATETASYIGCYADMDGNGTVDGYIFADLAHSKSGLWNSESDYTTASAYSYEAQTGLKSYKITQKDYSMKWGTSDTSKTIIADVIAPVTGTTGKDRFYVMALKDFKHESETIFFLL